MFKNKISRRPFNPEKYGLTLCNKCNGLGKTSDKESSPKVCECCGGFGLVKMEGKVNPMGRSFEASCEKKV